jgi:predicted nucleotidyltransferase
MSEKVKSILAELRRRFEALYAGRLVAMILYGSQARGDAEPGSDIDVLVVLQGPVIPSDEIRRTLDDTVDLSYQHGESIMCVFVTEEEYRRERSPLLLNVRREGTPV